jgi:acyl carrier protein
VQELESELLNIFELDTVSESDILKSYEMWDSLSVLSLIAFLDDRYGIGIDAAELAEISTVAALFEFVEANRVR